MDRKLKHLEFVQNVVNRLSTNSFLLKGWSVILVSGLFALSAHTANVRFILIAYLPALAFWALDAFFLGLERSYRKHFEQVRLKGADQIDFSMDASYAHEGFKEWFSAFFSITLIWFHGALLMAVVVVSIYFRKGA
jgi:hypothetical protein